MLHKQAKAPTQAAAPIAGLINEKQFLQNVPVSRKTLWKWKADGLIPYIKIGRRCLYDWPTVHAALLRMQRGGTQ